MTKMDQKIILFEELTNIQLNFTTSMNFLFSSSYNGQRVIVKAPRDDIPEESFRESVFLFSFHKLINEFSLSIIIDCGS